MTWLCAGNIYIFVSSKHMQHIMALPNPIADSGKRAGLLLAQMVEDRGGKEVYTISEQFGKITGVGSFGRTSELQIQDRVCRF